MNHHSLSYSTFHSPSLYRASRIVPKLSVPDDTALLDAGQPNACSSEQTVVLTGQGSPEIIKTRIKGPKKNRGSNAKRKQLVRQLRTKQSKAQATKPMTCLALDCNYCQQPARLVDHKELYGKSAPKLYWFCQDCDAYVGCHPAADVNGKGGVGDGTVPMGTLANSALRRLRMKAHGSFDPFWKKQGWSRTEAYSWLAKALELPRSKCHIAMMDNKLCQQVQDLVRKQYTL